VARDRLGFVFLEYLSALKSAWVILLSGGISVLLSLIAAIAEWKWAPAWLFWVAAAVAFLLASYEVWKRDHIKLQHLLERKLEILFEATQPTYFQEHPGVPLFRVCVWNTGSRTVDDVGVDAIRMEPADFEFLPVPLQAMHLLMGPLDPDGRRFFDVVQRFPNSSIQLVHSVPGAPCNLQPRKYRLTLQAHGRDAPAVERRFTLDVDGERLRLMPEETLSNPALGHV
jgi:hypothetical protein